MHEGGLCEGVLAVVLEAAAGQPVERVALRIGALQRVVTDSFDFYWQMFAAGTSAEGARLDIVEVPVRIHCRGCGSEQELGDPALPLCSACSSANVQLLSGDRVDVESVQLTSGEIVRNPAFDIREEHEHIHD